MALNSKNSLMAVCFTLFTSGIFAQFTTGNIVVLQAGDGTTALSSAAAPIILKEFTPTGTPAFSVAIPTSTVSGNSMVMSGSATAEGLMTRSVNGYFLIIPGFVSSAGTTGIAATTATAAPRAVGSIDASGSYTRVATSTSFFSGSDIRGTVSDGTGNYWASGANQGTNYFGTVSTPTLVQNTVTNTRAIEIYNNQLYFSTGSGARGIYAVGTGTPIGSTTATLAIATATNSSPYQFCFNATGNVCYIADDASVANGGGLQKWTYNGSAWSIAYTYTFTTNPRGVTVNFSGTNPVIYATTGETTGNHIVSIIDGGSVGTSTVTTIATAATNTIFRGIAFSPIPCIAPNITLSGSNGPICSNQSLALNVTAGGSTPLTYTWTGSGTFSSASVSNPTVTGASSGNYSVSISNACGTATTAVSVVVNALPTISVNSASICTGSTATLTASGASTYTWNTTDNTASIAVSTTSNTNYTVTGTDINNCVNTGTTSVTVNMLPTVSVNSATVCAGSSTTLTAGGANTYTWSTSDNTSSIMVNPVSNTNYTVVGTDGNGCMNFAIASVTANPLPPVMANSAAICTGASATLTANGASTYTWSTSDNTTSIAVNPTSNTTYTVVGTDGNGCMNFATASVTVNPLPTITANSATICTGTSAALTANGASTYTWSTSDNTASIAVNPTSNTTYTVVGTDGNACVNSATASVTVNGLPVVTANSATVCSGNSATLTANGALTYTWSNTDNTASTIVNPTSNTTYTVTGEDANGCMNSATGSVSVTPAPSITVNSATICAGNSATLTASGVSTYTWNTGSNNTSITVSPLAFTVYTVSGNAPGCPVTHNTATVTVNAIPSVSLSAVSPLCVNSPTVTLNGSPSGGSYAGTGVTGNVFHPSTAGVGTFTVSYMYTNSNSCSNSASTTVNVSNCTGIDEVIDHTLNVYPNPVQDQLNISFENSSLASTIEIYDALGHLVYSAEIMQNTALVNTSLFNTGIYILKLKTNHSQNVTRFIKN